MAQARVKKTGAVIDVIPKSKDGILHMYDTKGDTFYTWDDLEPVKIKTGMIPVSVVAAKIEVTPTINATITSRTKLDSEK